MYNRSLVGRSTVQGVPAPRFDSSDEVQVGRFLEWHHIFHPSHVANGYDSSCSIGLDMEYFVRKKWKPTDDYLGPCYVEFPCLSGELVGAVEKILMRFLHEEI